MSFILSYGLGKPVRINTAYYRNKRQGIIWVSLAGPVANFLTAFLSLLICGALMRFGNSGNSAVSIGVMLCYYSAVINIGLGVFNLIPIPPLDGSNVVEQMYPGVFYFLPEDPPLLHTDPAYPFGNRGFVKTFEYCQ